MLLYACDRCGKVYKDIGYLDELTINYAGQAEVKFYKNGKYLVCPKCVTFFLNELKAWDLNDNKENMEENNG